MKITKQLLFGIAIVSVSLSCQLNTTEETTGSQDTEKMQNVAKDVNPIEFQKLIGENAIILDVRRAIEFEAGHLEGAINIDYFSKNFISEVMKLDASKTLLIYCASGGRSANSMRKLSGKGFSTMYNMVGGFGAWKRSNLPSVK